MKLSIIIPVYNVEQYIRSCVESIYRQDLNEEDFEVILVNDGTQDDSFEIINDLISTHTNIVVLEQENKGLSVARNRGLAYASGQYVLFVDSDDMLIDKSLSKLCSMLDSYPVDMLIAGFVKMNNQEIISFNGIASTDFITETKQASDIFLHKFNPQECYVWRTLYRRDFLEDINIRFIPDVYFEDVPFTVECYLKANMCIYTSLVFYIYRQRENSVVSSINVKKIFDINTVLARLWKMKQDPSLPKEIQRQLMNSIFSTFSVSIWYISHSTALYEQKQIIISNLKQKVPDICFTNGFKQRIVSLMFKLSPRAYIKIRFIMFNMGLQ